MTTTLATAAIGDMMRISQAWEAISADTALATSGDIGRHQWVAIYGATIPSASMIKTRSIAPHW